ncbi:MAG: peptide chain release factor 1 [Candidatus Andersenbacteria bacterium]
MPSPSSQPSQASLDKVLAEFAAVEQQLADPSVTTNPTKLSELGREQARLEPIVQRVRRLLEVRRERTDAEQLAAAERDASLKTLALDEVGELEREEKALLAQLDVDLLPHDPTDDRDAILEIRAGAGGDEAGLFAADLLRMYTRYGERRGWSMPMLSASRSGIGGFKEVVVEVKGPGAYGVLKYESGVHRVQRIPSTEKSGRIHTSTATVAMLPVAEEVDIDIKPQDLRVDVFRSGGHGGQSVNTTDSAVRITHLPTGVVVSMQDEKSQLKNKEKAMRILRTRLLDAKQEQAARERSSLRRVQIGTGDRSEKIRTYNVPQDRITDHRIKVTVHGVARVFDGDLQELTDALAAANREQVRKIVS